jgi:hypothetical protein
VNDPCATPFCDTSDTGTRVCSTRRTVGCFSTVTMVAGGTN